ncbi:MAG: sensor histidine kinase [Bacteroidota bacterium]|nr:sensor histidine kinase [Bacteroidota bacterium]
MLLILLFFIVSFLFIYKNRQVRHRAEMESVKEKYNQEILKTQLEIREQTMKNISEEIHDNVGQVLSLVVLSLSAIELNDTTKAAAKIESTTKLVEKVVSDLRNLSKTLDADNVANVGLVAIIKFELELLEKTGVYRTLFRLSGTEKKLNGSKEIVLYRIIQESLNNIIKHAKATMIKISLDFSDTQLQVEITDDGKGFDAGDSGEKNMHRSGAGIKNMKKRANLIGGSLAVKSVPSMGTTVSMIIPFSPAG